MKDTIRRIFDCHVEDYDRVSLVKFCQERFARKVFSFVRKDKNLIQIRNQITDKVWDDENQSSFETSGVQSSAQKFPDTAENLSRRQQKLFAKAIKLCL